MVIHVSLGDVELMTFDNLHSEVNARLALTGKPPVSREELLVTVYVLAAEGRVTIDGKDINSNDR